MKLREIFGRRARREQELNEEIEAHLRMAARDRVERGEPAEEARYAAAREFGNPLLVKDVTRGVWDAFSLEQSGREVRRALRGMARTPGFTAAAILALAGGLAAAAVIFSVVNCMLLRPLPFRNSDRIVTVSDSLPFFGPRHIVVTLREYLGWRSAGVFEHCAAVEIGPMTLTGAGAAERLNGAVVGADFFRTFGVAPILGRDFLPEDERANAAPAVVLSHQLWARKFHFDRSVIGRTIHLGEALRTVVGVMPAGFQFPRRVDLGDLMTWAVEETEFWVPLQIREIDVRRGNFNYLVIGQLRPGLRYDTAQARLLAIARASYEEQARLRVDDAYYQELFRRNIAGMQVWVEPLQNTMTGSVRSTVWILFAAVGMLLLLIYANLASLFVTRTAGRLREVAIRQALGANFWQICRERIAESAAFGILASALSLLLTVWGITAVRSIGGSRVPRLYELTLDWRTVAFLAILTVAASLLFGLTPMFLARRFDAGARLHEHGRSISGGKAEARLRGWLVGAEFALSVVLLAGAGLLLESFRQVLHSDPGFDPNRLLTGGVALDFKKIPAVDQQYRQFERILDGVRALPEVEAASMVNWLPLTGEAETHTVRPYDGGGETGNAEHAEMRMADPEYLRTMRVPLRSGRWFREDDGKQVTVLSANLAQRFWPDRDAIGRQIRDGDNDPMTVIGVVGEVRNATLEREPTFQFYRPAVAAGFGVMSLAIRTRTDPENVLSEVRAVIAKVDPELPLARPRSMREIVDATTLPRRFETWLLASFAGTAVFLAALGAFGVLSLAVARRMREFGIRMALGASAGAVQRLVLTEAGRLLAAGAVAGLALALPASRFLRSLLYGVRPTDPRIYAGAIVVLAAAGFLACWLPALRAARTDPAMALREE